MTALQEFIDKPAAKAIPEGSETREARVLVRISEAKVSHLFKQIGIIFDKAAIPDHDAYFLKREVCRVIDDFLGRTRR